MLVAAVLRLRAICRLRRGDRRQRSGSMRGVALLCDGEYERAGEVLAKGLEFSKATTDVRAALLGNLGQSHQRLGRLDSALVSYQSAVALYRQSGFAAGEAQALGDLGAAYFMQGDPEQALGFLKQARDGHRRLGDQLGLARDLDRIGTVYFVRGAADSARSAFAKALELYRDEGYLRGQAGGLTNIGNIHLDEGRLDSAHFYFSAGLAVLERLADDAAPRNSASADWTNLPAAGRSRSGVGRLPRGAFYTSGPGKGG